MSFSSVAQSSSVGWCWPKNAAVLRSATRKSSSLHNMHGAPVIGRCIRTSSSALLNKEVGATNGQISKRHDQSVMLLDDSNDCWKESTRKEYSSLVNFHQRATGPLLLSATQGYYAKAVACGPQSPQLTRNFSASASPNIRSSAGSDNQSTSTDTNVGGVKKGGKAPHASVQRRKRISETPVAEVLKQKHAYKWTDYVISSEATIQEAIVLCIERGLAGMMIVEYGKKEQQPIDNSSNKVQEGTLPIRNDNDEESLNVYDEDTVLGLITTRDLLRTMATEFSRGDQKSAEEVVNQKVTDHMCPLNQIIFARPHETIGLCRTLMAKLQIQCLPILSNGDSSDSTSTSFSSSSKVYVEGIITSRDLAEFGLDKGKDIGGKKNYLTDVSQRVGLSSQITSMAEPPSFLKASLTHTDKPLFVNVGIVALPHPFKGSDKVNAPSGHSRKEDYYTEDVNLSEDAHFHATIQVPVVVKHKTNKVTDESSSSINDASWNVEDDVDSPTDGEDTIQQEAVIIDMKEVTYMGVADGVGSWREYGVDPRLFSHALMSECHNVLMEHAAAAAANAANAVANKANTADGLSTTTCVTDAPHHQILFPKEVMALAYDRVTQQPFVPDVVLGQQPGGIVGSSTACIGMFDCLRHQLHYANLGDSGIMLLRHLDHNVAGTLKRARSAGRRRKKGGDSFDDESDVGSDDDEEDHDEKLKYLKVQYVSQQQLMSFNHPYQLGWTGQHLSASEQLSSSLKKPSDSYEASLHVRRGDIIIMATDGLFDNVDVDEICQIAVEWETRHNFLLGDVEERARRWQKGESKAALSAEVVPDLASALCRAARANSLMTDVDSPFAILAKENDILWSGGMPDDCTVIAMHVVGRASHSDIGVESV